MRTACAGSYVVAAGQLSGEQTDNLAKELTLRPRQSAYSSVAPDPIQCLSVDPAGGSLEMPRFFGVARFGPPADASGLADGEPMAADAHFLGRLRDDHRPQVAAHDACVAELGRAGLRGGLLVLPCGFGKTVVAIRIACTLARRTIVVVGKDFLMQQWRREIEEFVPGARVGRIQQDVVDVHGADFVLAMIQSLSARAYGAAVLGTFGLAVFDECHHVAAPCFNRAVRRLGARRVLGLSATPDRRDGLGPLLAWSLGDVLFRAARPATEVRVACLKYTGGAQREFRSRDGRAMIARMQTTLCDEPRRNAMIAREVAALYYAGRHTIVLSDRLEQLRALRLLVTSLGVPAAEIADYVGSTRPAAREAAEACDVILSTYSMAREGLDVPRLDTLVMASPIGGVEQAVGRIQRGGADTQVPLVVDVHDPFGPFERMHAGRRAYYRKAGFDVHALECAGAIHDRPAAWAVGAG